MVAGLRLILNQTPWFLVLKTAATAVLWLIYPPWIWLLFVWGVYLSAFSQTLSLLPLFATWLFLAFILPVNPWTAMYLGLVFFLILGMKEYLFLYRRNLYQITIFLLGFVLAYYFFWSLPWWRSPGDLLMPLGPSILASLMLFGLMRYENEAALVPAHRTRYRLMPFIAVLLWWQLGAVLLFVPMGFATKAALWFLGVATLMQLMMEDVAGRMDRRNVLLISSVFIFFSVVFLAGNSWRI